MYEIQRGISSSRKMIIYSIWTYRLLVHYRWISLACRFLQCLQLCLLRLRIITNAGSYSDVQLICIQLSFWWIIKYIWNSFSCWIFCALWLRFWMLRWQKERLWVSNFVHHIYLHFLPSICWCCHIWYHLTRMSLRWEKLSVTATATGNLSGRQVMLLRLWLLRCRAREKALRVLRSTLCSLLSTTTRWGRIWSMK